MNGVRQEFRKRASDASAFVRHVAEQEDSGALPPADLALHTLRGATYLVIYNMVEATAREGFSAIFDHLESHRVSFDRASIPLRCFILKSAKHPDATKLEKKLDQIAVDVFSAVFDPSRLFSGNVDSKRLRELAKELGYEHHPGRGSAELLKIKNKRNDLAHGLKSFSEMGRAVLAKDLKGDLATTILYLRRFLTEIERFLSDKTYLASTPDTLDVTDQNTANA